MHVLSIISYGAQTWFKAKQSLKNLFQDKKIQIQKTQIDRRNCNKMQ